MRVIAVSGLHRSGKTTVVEHVVAELVRRGYAVGTVKSIHKEGFSIDRLGSNTHRHRMAGASMVTAVSDGETAVMMTRRASYQEILSWYDTDWVVIEGARGEPYARIVCARTVDDIDECFDVHTFAVCGPVADGAGADGAAGGGITRWRGVPVLDARVHYREVVDLAEEKATSVSKPAAAGQAGYEERYETLITVDGVELPLNPFIQEFVARTVKAMVMSLKDAPDGDEIRVEIRRF